MRRHRPCGLLRRPLPLQALRRGSLLYRAAIRLLIHQPAAGDGRGAARRGCRLLARLVLVRRPLGTLQRRRIGVALPLPPPLRLGNVPGIHGLHGLREASLPLPLLAGPLALVSLFGGPPRLLCRPLAGGGGARRRPARLLLVQLLLQGSHRGVLPALTGAGDGVALLCHALHVQLIQHCERALLVGPRSVRRLPLRELLLPRPRQLGAAPRRHGRAQLVAAALELLVVLGGRLCRVGGVQVFAQLTRPLQQLRPPGGRPRHPLLRLLLPQLLLLL